MDFFCQISRVGMPLVFAVSLAFSTQSEAATVVRFDTVEGQFDIQLFDDVMPRTVQNFLVYVTSEKYDGTTVHRNSDTPDVGGVRDFVIQGGGFTLHDPIAPNTTISYSRVETDPPIVDEPGGGVAGPSNVRGTLAMAKSGKNTVTSQWFINQGDNSFLDDPGRPDGGFSAFGIVLNDGMVVVDAIGDLPVPTDFGFSINSPFNDLPLRNFSGSSISDIRVANTVTVNKVWELAVIPGDFNLDGEVNTADMTIWSAGYGISRGGLLDDGDADGDGDVDGNDFLLCQANTHSSMANHRVATTVPEPAAWVLVAITLALAGIYLPAANGGGRAEKVTPTPIGRRAGGAFF